eukprot:TRINITY_DN32667_c0_g1_i1.p1 TRINITY_DN32667_c0_g1~~TRINITY_DN32667_c0_g1_i1.p1  ORF type:complete len:447 (-),score=72.26 TRINITY_DN32667_c0_g1_i1:265-1605(-)
MGQQHSSSRPHDSLNIDVEDNSIGGGDAADSRPVLPKGGRFDNPNYRKYPPMEVMPEDIPEPFINSCFPLPSPRPISMMTQGFLSDNAPENESDYPHSNPSLGPSYSHRQPGCLPPIRVDCRKVSSPLGAAWSKLCGYQPVMIKKSQHVFCMRHGERLDVVDPTWAVKAQRPWDPPLTDWGKWQSFQVGARLRAEGYGVTRIVCSPYLRCLQTAVEVARALAGEPAPGAEGRGDGNEAGEGDAAMEEEEAGWQDPKNANGKRPGGRRRKMMEKFKESFRRPRKRTKFDPSAPGVPPPVVKVSVDFGLCEVASSMLDPSRQREVWLPSMEEVERFLFLEGLDVERPRGAWRDLPPWPENIRNAVIRFVATIDRIAEGFLDENVLVITHGEAVQASVMRCQKVRVANILFGAYSHLQRNVYRDVEDSDTCGVGVWKLETKAGNTGIFW